MYSYVIFIWKREIHCRVIYRESQQLKRDDNSEAKSLYLHGQYLFSKI